MLALFPIVAMIGIALNLFIRARGGRSFSMRLKGFGIDLTVESLAEKGKKEDKDEETK